MSKGPRFRVSPQHGFLQVYILFSWAEYILEDGVQLTTGTTLPVILYVTHPSSRKIRWLAFLTWLSGDPIFDA